ncbi:MAG: MBL fold metallo-hydrolase [Desulfurococcaceae archaeon]
MKLVFLGVGGWISKPILGHTSVLIEENNDRILLDSGECTARALHVYGKGLERIRGIVVTHLHGDHVLGLPTILMLLKHMGYPGISVYVPGESARDLLELLRITGVNYEGFVRVVGVEHGDEHEVGVFRLKFIRAVHTMPSLSVRVSSRDKCVVYSGDTSYNPTLVELAKGCDLLIHEVSGYDPSSRMYGHSTFEDALRVADEAGVKKVILVHYYMDVPCIKPSSIRTSGEFNLAYPGFEIQV